MKRLFIATKIELDSSFAQLRLKLQSELRHNNIVWVEDSLRHLTLRFLGATPNDKVPFIKDALQQVCSDSTPFYLELNKLGVFGSHYHPEVLWFGFEEFFFFKQLFERLEPKLLDQGFAPSYGNFVPHITLGRVKKVVDKKRFWECFERCKPSFSQMIPVKEMTLYQSFLHNDGPEYKALATYKLKDMV